MSGLLPAAARLLGQLVHASVPLVRSGYALAVRQVIITGWLSAMWAVFWLIMLAITIWQLPRLLRGWLAWFRRQQQAPWESSLVSPTEGAVWALIVGSAVLIIWLCVVGAAIAGDIQTAFYNLGNPQWQALLLLKQLVFGH